MNIPIQYSILKYLPLTAVLTTILIISTYLSKTQGSKKANPIQLLDTLATINLNKIIYGSAPAAIIRYEKNIDKNIYNLKKLLIRGLYPDNPLKNNSKKEEDDMANQLLRMLLGKERISVTTIHSAMNEAKLFLSQKIDRAELYLIISTAIFIFTPILTILGIILLRNQIILITMYAGLSITISLLTRWLEGWIKT